MSSIILGRKRDILQACADMYETARIDRAPPHGPSACELAKHSTERTKIER